MIDRSDLVQSLRGGAPLIVGDGSLPPPGPSTAEMTDNHVLDADLLRSVLVEVASGSLASIDPRGLRLQGVAIRGNLDLGLLRIPHSLHFLHCRFEGCVLMPETHVRGWLRFPGCHVDGVDHDGWSIFAEFLQVESSLDLDQDFVSQGALALSGARVGGQLTMTDAQVRGTDADGLSIEATHVEVGSGTFLSAIDTEGAVALSSSRLKGQLVLRGARLGGANSEGWSLVAQNLDVDSDAFLDDGFDAAGAITMHGARIGGQLSMERARIRGRDSTGGASMDKPFAPTATWVCAVGSSVTVP